MATATATKSRLPKFKESDIRSYCMDCKRWNCPKRDRCRMYYEANPYNKNYEE